MYSCKHDWNQIIYASRLTSSTNVAASTRLQMLLHHIIHNNNNINKCMNIKQTVNVTKKMVTTSIFADQNYNHMSSED